MGSSWELPGASAEPWDVKALLHSTLYVILLGSKIRSENPLNTDLGIFA